MVPIPSAELKRFMDEEIERFRSLVITALPYDAARGDSLTMTSAPFFTDPPQDYQLPWHKDPAIIEWGRHAMTSLGLVAFSYWLSHSAQGIHAKDRRKRRAIGRAAYRWRAETLIEKHLRKASR